MQRVKQGVMSELETLVELSYPNLTSPAKTLAQEFIKIPAKVFFFSDDHELFGSGSYRIPPVQQGSYLYRQYQGGYTKLESHVRSL